MILLTMTLAFGIASPPVPCDLHLITPTGARDVARFGGRMAMDGDTAIIGVNRTLSGWFPNGPFPALGHVEMHRLVDGAWRPDAAYEMSDVGFGAAVAVTGDWAFVGAPLTTVSRGAVHAFRRDGDDWAFAFTITEPEIDVQESFGGALAAHGDTLAVASGQIGAGAMTGTVFMYRRLGDDWVREHLIELTAGPTPAIGDIALALDEERLVVGTPKIRQVNVYNDLDGWPLEASLGAPIEPDFGRAVDVEGSVIAVGSPGTPAAVRVFEPIDGFPHLWVLVQSIDSPLGGNSRFGDAVDLRGDRLAVGAPVASNQPGRAFTFVRSTEGPWIPESAPLPDPSTNLDGFGSSVALVDVDGAILIGAPGLMFAGNSGGVLTIGYPAGLDCNGNDINDACEIAPGSLGDCNANGIPDDCDLADGTSVDADGDGLPDECAIDCDGDGYFDYLAIGAGLVTDCNGNGIPDSCDLARGDLTDCNGNGIADLCEILDDPDLDCNGNGVPDSCDIADRLDTDCDADGVPDTCQVIDRPGLFDCNGNGTHDACDIADGTSVDENGDGIPDECPPGLCCLTPGVCVFIDPEPCQTVGGTWLGADLDCEACRVGACCLVDDCRVMYASDCIAAGGVFAGAQTTCEDLDGNGLANACESVGLVGDFNGDLHVNAADLAILLANWGPSGHQTNIDGVSGTGAGDLALLLALWTG